VHIPSADTQQCCFKRYSFLPPGPAKNHTIMPTTGKNNTPNIHSIFSVPEAEDWIILMTAKISKIRTSKPNAEYIMNFLNKQ
jgi:hypothetical protein